MMKKLINDPNHVVNDMLEGMAAAYPNRLRRLPGTNVMVRKDAPVQGKVGVVSGGGSGHEPAHAGYVGKGMLDAAVCGEVFTSPTPDQVLEAIKAVDSGKGV
jgi:phosphoenolpyruvate---glycerone phosphotransferase subunit DhaK